jgi:hypothetical protein
MVARKKTIIRNLPHKPLGITRGNILQPTQDPEKSVSQGVLLGFNVSTGTARVQEEGSNAIISATLSDSSQAIPGATVEILRQTVNGSQRTTIAVVGERPTLENRLGDTSEIVKSNQTANFTGDACDITPTAPPGINQALSSGDFQCPPGFVPNCGAMGS